MLRALLNKIFHRPAFRSGRAGSARLRRKQSSHTRFTSCIEVGGGFSPRRFDGHEARLRRARLFRRVSFAALAALGTWVVIESAQALSMF